MDDFKNAYFILFSAICDSIERTECLLQTDSTAETWHKAMAEQCEQLKFAQQRAEEILLSNET